MSLMHFPYGDWRKAAPDRLTPEVCALDYIRISHGTLPQSREIREAGHGAE